MKKKKAKIGKRHINTMKRVYDELQTMRISIIERKVKDIVSKHNCKTSDCELVFVNGDYLPRAIQVKNEISYLIGVM